MSLYSRHPFSVMPFSGDPLTTIGGGPDTNPETGCCCSGVTVTCDGCPSNPLSSTLYLTLAYISGPSDCLDGEVIPLIWDGSAEDWRNISDYPTCELGNNMGFSFRCDTAPATEDRCYDQTESFSLENGCGGLSYYICHTSRTCDPFEVQFDNFAIANFCLDPSGAFSFYDGVVTE